MLIIGIDPGATGAIVMLDKGVPIEWEPMPTIKVGKGSRVNGAALAAFLRDHRDAHVFVENVGAMPGQTGMFAFGHACGTVMGALFALEMAHTLVTPMVWKKRAGLIGKDKDAARTRAIQLWPSWRDLDAKGKGQALADAALIAKFGAIA
jgi:crossover junction endodeoxyribonuclease RuvC